MVCTIVLGQEHSVTSRNEEAKLHHSMKHAHFMDTTVSLKQVAARLYKILSFNSILKCC